MAWKVRVKDRGRDLALHEVERHDEARQLQRVYQLLGYAPEKVLLERVQRQEKAA